MRLTLLIFFLGLTTLIPLHGQLEEVPSANNPHIRQQLYLESVTPPPYVFMSTGNDTLGLPFLDDFSYEGPFPNIANWCDKGAFVNHTFSKEPPSIGVATLDGLDSSGSPYNMTGAGDELTSNPFFLGNYTDEDQVYLSFFTQAKGWGDKPEVEDSLIVEFKGMDDTWINIASYAGIDGNVFPSSYIPDFTFVALPIPTEYLYDGFQFRFRNKSSGRGQVDLWHIDYVRLTTSFLPTTNFNDVAFTDQPSSFLSRYTAMPWRQFAGFESQELSDSYSLTLYNHFPVTQEIQNRIYTVEENGTNYLNTNFYTDIVLANIEQGIHVSQTQSIAGVDFSTFQSNMLGLNTDRKYVFESEFSFTQTGQDPAFPASFANDIVRRKTIFDNYFAYDDGTAESNVKAQNPGTEIAVQYYLNQADTLKAIQMHIPHVINDVSNQLFNLKVYTDLGTTPVYTANFQSPIYVDEYSAADTLQGMTTYILKDILGDPAPILLPPGEFYVAWQQVSETERPIPIGFDRNNPDASQYNFFNAGGGWEPFPSTLEGAIMLRPVVGAGVLFTTPNTDLEADGFFNIYPNPADEVLVFQTHSGDNFEGDIRILDVSGKTVLSSDFMEFIPTVQLENGIYFIQINDWETGQIYHHKVVVQH